MHDTGNQMLFSVHISERHLVDQFPYIASSKKISYKVQGKITNKNLRDRLITENLVFF